MGKNTLKTIESNAMKICDSLVKIDFDQNMTKEQFVDLQRLKARIIHRAFTNLDSDSNEISLESLSLIVTSMLHLAEKNAVSPLALITESCDCYLQDSNSFIKTVKAKVE
jgi:hypothetical protein